MGCVYLLFPNLCWYIICLPLEHSRRGEREEGESSVLSRIKKANELYCTRRLRRWWPIGWLLGEWLEVAGLAPAPAPVNNQVLNFVSFIYMAILFNQMKLLYFPTFCEYGIWHWQLAFIFTHTQYRGAFVFNLFHT
jgi:hypothetical protein